MFDILNNCPYAYAFITVGVIYVFFYDSFNQPISKYNSELSTNPNIDINKFITELNK